MEAELGPLGVLDRAHDRLRALSGGLRRRVEIARALLQRRAFSCSTSRLFGSTLARARAILGHARRLSRERDVTVLWATHLMDEVGESDQVLVLNEGMLLRSGTFRDIRREFAAENIAEAFVALTERTA